MGLNEVTLLVQVWGLPFHYQTTAMGSKIGSRLGKVVDVGQFRVTGSVGLILKVLITVEVSSPLKHGMQLASSRDSSVWVDFKYERLPQFCYYCGLLGHDDKLCSSLLDDEEHGVVKEKKRGPWLRADQTGRRVEGNSGVGEKSNPMHATRGAPPNHMRGETHAQATKLSSVLANLSMGGTNMGGQVGASEKEFVDEGASVSPSPTHGGQQMGSQVELSKRLDAANLIVEEVNGKSSNHEGKQGGQKETEPSHLSAEVVQPHGGEEVLEPVLCEVPKSLPPTSVSIPLEKKWKRLAREGKGLSGTASRDGGKKKRLVGYIDTEPNAEEGGIMEKKNRMTGQCNTSFKEAETARQSRQEP